MMLSTKAELSIFDFTDYRSFLLQKGLPQGFYAHTAKNLKSWAQRLGYKSPSSLSMVLTGERFPSEEMIDRFSADFELTAREKRYLRLLVEYEKALSQKKDVTLLLQEIQQASSKHTQSVEGDVFAIMNSWYFFAIKQLVGTPAFSEDVEWIKQRLRNKVNEDQIKDAFKILEDLKMITRTEDGKLVLSKQSIITQNDMSSETIKQHHREMIGLSLQALDEQSIEERQFSSTTIRMEKANIAKAKKFVFDFIKEFSAQFYDVEGEDIYQLNSSLFELTAVVESKKD